MESNKICKKCGKPFKGGFNALYCIDCRKLKQREYTMNYGKRLEKGLERTNGIAMKCERCGKTIIRSGALQKYCIDCRKEVAREKSRLKERKKTELRRSVPRICRVCNKEFFSINGNLCCSDECKRAMKNKREREKRNRL